MSERLVQFTRRAEQVRIGRRTLVPPPHLGTRASPLAHILAGPPIPCGLGLALALLPSSADERLPALNGVHHATKMLRLVGEGDKSLHTPLLKGLPAMLSHHKVGHRRPPPFGCERFDARLPSSQKLELAPIPPQMKASRVLVKEQLVEAALNQGLLRRRHPAAVRDATEQIGECRLEMRRIRFLLRAVDALHPLDAHLLEQS